MDSECAFVSLHLFFWISTKKSHPETQGGGGVRTEEKYIQGQRGAGPETEARERFSHPQRRRPQVTRGFRENHWQEDQCKKCVLYFCTRERESWTETTLLSFFYTEGKKVNRKVWLWNISQVFILQFQAKALSQKVFSLLISCDVRMSPCDQKKIQMSHWWVIDTRTH